MPSMPDAIKSLMLHYGCDELKWQENDDRFVSPDGKVEARLIASAQDTRIRIWDGSRYNTVVVQPNKTSLYVGQAKASFFDADAKTALEKCTVLYPHSGEVIPDPDQYESLKSDRHVLLSKEEADVIETYAKAHGLGLYDKMREALRMRHLTPAQFHTAIAEVIQKGKGHAEWLAFLADQKGKRPPAVAIENIPNGDELLKELRENPKVVGFFESASEMVDSFLKRAGSSSNEEKVQFYDGTMQYASRVWVQFSTKESNADIYGKIEDILPYYPAKLRPKMREQALTYWRSLAATPDWPGGKAMVKQFLERYPPVEDDLIDYHIRDYPTWERDDLSIVLSIFIQTRKCHSKATPATACTLDAIHQFRLTHRYGFLNDAENLARQYPAQNQFEIYKYLKEGLNKLADEKKLDGTSAEQLFADYKRNHPLPTPSFLGELNKETPLYGALAAAQVLPQLTGSEESQEEVKTAYAEFYLNTPPYMVEWFEQTARAYAPDRSREAAIAVERDLYQKIKAQFGSRIPTLTQVKEFCAQYRLDNPPPAAGVLNELVVVYPDQVQKKMAETLLQRCHQKYGDKPTEAQVKAVFYDFRNKNPTVSYGILEAKLQSIVPPKNIALVRERIMEKVAIHFPKRMPDTSQVIELFNRETTIGYRNMLDLLWTPESVVNPETKTLLDRLVTPRLALYPVKEQPQHKAALAERLDKIGTGYLWTEEEVLEEIESYMEENPPPLEAQVNAVLQVHPESDRERLKAAMTAMVQTKLQGVPMGPTMVRALYLNMTTPTDIRETPQEVATAVTAPPTAAVTTTAEKAEEDPIKKIESTLATLSLEASEFNTQIETIRRTVTAIDSTRLDDIEAKLDDLKSYRTTIEKGLEKASKDQKTLGDLYDIPKLNRDDAISGALNWVGLNLNMGPAILNRINALIKQVER